MEKGISPWAAAAASEFANNNSDPIYTHNSGVFNFAIYSTAASLWIRVQWPKGGNMLLRAAFTPANDITVKQAKENEEGVELSLSSVIGDIKVKIAFTGDDNPILRYTTTLEPKAALLVPFWPRDIIVPGKNGRLVGTAGKIHASQVGTRTGFIYASMTRPKAGTFFYMQNLTALGEYCQQTETSCGGSVAGQWPEMGFALPAAANKPLDAGKEIVIGDAFVAFDTEVPATESAMVKQYLDMLAAIYLQMPKPPTNYKHWPDVLDKGLKDLIDSPGCWVQVGGNHYFNAYVSDYETPPEIMVQLAVLLPLLDYVEWSEAELDVMKKIKEGLPAFYDEKIGFVMRWLPAAEDQLKGEEEQKMPKVMDSWYLHHPMLNLSRLALKGDEVAKKLFLDSLEFAIKVAHHFKYQWPVFYKMDTLEVLKAETQPGKGGEKDVPGLYAHIMLQAWELTGKKRYLHEAEKAAKKLKGLGFELFYQANNTAFSAGALLRLYKVTNNKDYLQLSYLCLVNIFKNVQLWDCNYGYGRNFPSFFALFPLSDAPYTAVYEEQEVFCAFHDYLRHAEDVDILPSIKLLTAEYIRYLVDRAVYYYPTMLPKEMLVEKPKIGELDPNLWIALEDMHDGWEQCGEVGQEVYGAGNAFGILPRHYMHVTDEDFMIYIDYPISGFKPEKRRPVNFKVLGDERLNCRLMIIAMEKKKLPKFTVTLNGKKQEIEGKRTNDGHLEYTLPGNSRIKIDWKK